MSGIENGATPEEAMSEKINLLAWCRETEPWCDPSLNYAGAQKQQILFVRDVITPLLTRVSPWGDQGAYIIGWHYSKSVRLPVYYIDAAWAEVVLRDNFYNYNVTIRSKVGPLCVDTDGLLADPHYLFFEGMDGWREEPLTRGAARSRFSFCVQGREAFYAAMFLFAREGFRKLRLRLRPHTAHGSRAGKLLREVAMSDRRPSGTARLNPDAAAATPRCSLGHALTPEEAAMLPTHRPDVRCPRWFSPGSGAWVDRQCAGMVFQTRAEAAARRAARRAEE